MTKDGRYEVTAFLIKINTRVHITTVWGKKYGAKAQSDMTKIVDTINKYNIDNPAALQLKLQLMSA